MDQKLRALLEEAKLACDYAYAPYSKYRVGAAVLTNKGIFRGANIENASSNLGICAERVAISHALMNKADDIEAIAVFCLDAGLENGIIHQEGTMPCGACRQWMLELSPHAVVITNGSDDVYSVKDLLPFRFKLS